MTDVAICAQCRRQADRREIESRWWRIVPPPSETERGEHAPFALCSAQCVVAYFQPLANVPE